MADSTMFSPFYGPAPFSGVCLIAYAGCLYLKDCCSACATALGRGIRRACRWIRSLFRRSTVEYCPIDDVNVGIPEITVFGAETTQESSV